MVVTGSLMGQRVVANLKFADILVVVRYAAGLMVVVVFMFPVFWFGLTAIKPRSIIFDKDSIIWFDFVPTLQSFSTVLFGPSTFSVSQSMLSSIVVATGSTLLTLLLSVPAAYALSRFRFPARQWGLLAMVSLRFLPPIAIVIPLFYIFHCIGLRDTHIGIAVAHALINTPVAILIMKSFFDDVPASIDDMAFIDGASRLEAFWHIILPTVRGGVAATAILCFVFSWTEFLLSLFLTSSIRTLPVRMSLFDSGSQVNLIAATGTLSMIPGFVFILLVQKYLVRGLTMGALKD